MIIVMYLMIRKNIQKTIKTFIYFQNLKINNDGQMIGKMDNRTKRENVEVICYHNDGTQKTRILNQQKITKRKKIFVIPIETTNLDMLSKKLKPMLKLFLFKK